MAETDRKTDLERLKQVVGAYGAQSGRWPADDQKELAALALAHADAAWMRAAAELDHMLDHGAGAGQAGAPTGTILAAVRATAQRPPARNRPGTLASLDTARARRTGAANWPWAAVLAASLLIGIWAGANGAVEYLLPGTLGDALTAVNESEDESNFFGLFEHGPATTGEDII